MKWKDLGLSIKLSPYTLERIEAEHPRDVGRCVTQTLAEWLQRQGKAVPTWRALATAVTSQAIQRRDIAHRIARCQGKSK